MPRSYKEIVRDAERLSKRIESLEPAPVRDASALADLRNAVLERAAAEHRVADTVVRARRTGHTWSSIGAMLGTSGEAARQRYGLEADASHPNSRPSGRQIPVVGKRRAAANRSAKSAIHVTARPDGKWVAVREGARRAASVHQTKAAAVSAARLLAKKADAKLVVHKRDA